MKFVLWRRRAKRFRNDRIFTPRWTEVSRKKSSPRVPWTRASRWIFYTINRLVLVLVFFHTICIIYIEGGSTRGDTGVKSRCPERWPEMWKRKNTQNQNKRMGLYLIIIFVLFFFCILWVDYRSIIYYL